MKKAAKKLAILLLSSGLASVLLSLASEIAHYKMFVGTWIIMLVYGWTLYLPFIAIHAFLARRLQLTHPILLVASSSCLAVLLEEAQIWRLFFVGFSPSKSYDAFCFGIGAGCYALLYNWWIKPIPISRL